MASLDPQAPVPLLIAGQRDAGLRAQPVSTGDFLSVTVEDAFRVETLRSDARPVDLGEVPADALLELTLTDGLTIYATAGQLREDQQRGALRTGGDGAPSDALVVGPRLQLGSPTRSLASIGVKALRLLGIDLSGDLAEASALLVAERIEGKLDPQAGLYRTPTLDAVRQPATAGDFSTSDPALLFLHGTATNTFGSFGSLTEEGFAGSWRRLQQAYGDRIFAFEHRTLTQSPVRNALDLVEQLPARARLHLVSQSRGGLVGELLTRGHLVDAGLGTPRAPFDERDLRLFQEDEARAQELKDLHALNALLQDKQIQIERFVRVACPAGGTTLASRRLDRFFSTLVNLVGLIPVLRVNPVYQYVTALALAIIKKRTEPDALPGLEAMMPGSPLVRVLNNPAARVQAASALTVLAGDVKGSGLLGSLKVWAANRFYRGDHDYVVNTRSMYGGAPREGEATYFFDRHKSVTHFHYFQNERTRTALTQGVLGETTEDAGFRPLTERRRDEADEIKRSVEVVTRKGPRRPRPVVFVLPGIMGSHLSVGRDRIWLDFLDLARGGLRKLNIDAASVQPDGLVRLAYRKLVRYLKRSHHVEQMSYDWRRSVRDAAADLAQRVEAQLAATDLPVRLLAHSMGGLVARAFQLDHPEVWAKLTAREGGRLLMLGTPNGGSFVVRDILLGRARTIKMLGLLDLGSRRQTLINLVKAYPGLLELLPLDDTHDYYADALWDELDAFDPKARPAADALAAAREVRSALAALPFDAEHTYYVAGIDDATPIHHEVEGGDLKFWSTAEGDGRVPWASGIPQALIEAKHVWYMNAAHGKMADHRRSFKALRELLERGATTRLAQTPPRLRAEAVRFEAPEEEVDVFPTADTLAAAVLGFEPTPEDEPMAAARVQVRVTHGDLAYARHPVVIGHHQGDGIVSAEGQLDRYLDGRLTELHRMDLYPGAVGTAEVVLDDRFVHPPGGVIVGLGPFGELTQGHLADSYTQGVLRLAVERANHARAHEAPSADETEDTAAVRANGLSTILVGSGFGGLTLRESIRAILRGVERANERLRQFESEIPAITHVEIIELFEDRAIQAQRVVLDLARRAGAAFEAESPHLQRTRGARRVLGEQDESSWWHRLRVVAERDHERGGRRLVYTSLTARARAEVESQPLDHRLVRLVVDQASQHATWHPQEAEAIFQLLLPSRFKDLLADRPNLLWIVDNTTAAYPWELMHTPSLGEARPLAVQAGMLRQLQVVNPRGVGAPGPAPKVFIVADPKSAFAPLPAAQEEGRQVEALFRERRYTVSPPLIHSKALPIVSRLLVESYQVLHLAGHGVVNYRPDDAKPDEPPVTGMVLDGAFLTPPLIDQMEYVPDLVFLNCCYLGRAEAEHEALWRQRYQLAANLGMQFIRKGARAVVAAGWAIQ
ncbi:MAG: CHAT domain-containing protein, partial [Bacteroidota bacterium]